MMMDTMAPKENANPMILNVEKDRRLARRQPLEWKLLGNFEQGDDEVKWLPTTPEDRALLQALVDSSKATNRKGVSLLENAGLVIPDSTKTALKQLRDKERVCAALENKHLSGVVNKCIRNGMNGMAR